MKEEALKKVEAETGLGTVGEAVREYVKVWLEHEPGRAELVLAEGKSCAGCESWIFEQARKLAGGKGSLKTELEQDVSWVLEYFGLTKDEAQAVSEGWLMYEIQLMELKKRAPYGRDVAKDVAGITARAESVPTAEKADLSEVSLDDLF